MKKILLLLLTLVPFHVMADSIDTTTYKIDNVVITGTRYHSDIRHLPMTISVINQSKLIQNYKQNVLPTLSEQVPGLFVTSRGLLGYGVSTGSAGGIKVRGIGSMADLLVLIDGLPQYAGLYGHPIADVYQTMLADRVEVIRGPASMIYGSNAMGGVVNIVTRQTQQDGTTTNINLQGGSYGTFEANATNHTRSGKFSSVVGVNYGRTDGHRTNSEFKQTSGYAKLGYDFTPNWALSGNINVTYFESSNPGEVSNPYIDNDMMITRGMAAVSLTNEYEKTSGAIRAYYNWGHHHINDGYHPGGTPRATYYMHNDRMGGFSAYQNLSFMEGNHITLGLDYQHYGGHAWNKAMSNGAKTEIADKSVNEVAGYIDFRQDLAEWITLDAGIRLNHHSVSGNEWIPQGGFTFRLSNESEIRAMVSKGFRNPTIRELYMYRPANADLKPVRLMNYELSFKQRLFENRFNYNINVFYLKADNMIQTAMIEGKPLNINTGKTENSGVELEAAYHINEVWNINGNYSFLHMSNPQLSAPEHKIYMGINYQKKQFSVNTGLQYVAGLYTATGAKERKENFLLWNVTANYRVIKELRLFVKGENLLAQKYETVAGFPMPRATVMAGINWNF
ncbi:MAG: TonB-dependent receptor [Phocaeicola sp.]|uniref:TonB-dependent receptor n=2 Tax=Phocaeicola sp. TaxID=2773926 RepID=UPI003FA02C63